MRSAAILMVAMLMCATLAAAQEGPKRPPPTPQPAPTPETGQPESPGRASINVAGDAFIGELAPDFELDGSQGQPVQLSKQRGDWVVMVFAERRTDLMQLASVVADLRLLGGKFVGICDEKARTLEHAQERDPLPFQVLADPTGEVSAMYGCYDHVHSTTTPGFFVLDRRGTVRLTVLGQPVPAAEIVSLTKIPMGATQ